MSARVKSEEPRKSPHWYTEEELEFIKNNINEMSNSELVRQFNAKFNSDITNWQIYKLNQKWQWKKVYKKSEPKLKIWTPEIIEELGRIHKGKRVAEISDILYEKFGIRYTRDQILSKMAYKGWKTGTNGGFEKGHVPATKGRVWAEYMSEEQMEKAKATWFKQGHSLNMHYEIGETIIRKKRKYDRVAYYRYIKTGSRTWVAYGKYVYEQHYGKVKPKQKVFHIDGNTLNDNIENLMMVDNRDILEFNRFGSTGNPEIDEVLMLNVRLKNKIKDAERKGEDE